ncbi:unnamed protein product [Periconia digitata]|uniref:Zn(2)-C6 fungal-type domain-containing protein n=1 Tax=Periconia digitata TaxID=1303443 RepID=A0A9W4XSL6_9PLEO|nr:unnamed protein product [Periconia digitata]
MEDFTATIWIDQSITLATESLCTQNAVYGTKRLTRIMPSQKLLQPLRVVAGESMRTLASDWPGNTFLVLHLLIQTGTPPRTSHLHECTSQRKVANFLSFHHPSISDNSFDAFVMSQSGKLPYILPKPQGFQDEQTPAKRKRQRASVACDNCRQRKTKCDNQRPTCNSCKLANLTCQYNTLTSRQAEKQEKDDYERSAHRFQSALELLRQGSDADSAAVLQRIRETNDIEDAVTSISDAQLLVPEPRSSVSQQAERAVPRNRLLKSPYEDPEYMFSTGYSYVHEQYVDKDVFVDLPALHLDLARWTSACQDNRPMNHLLALFWTWDNSVQHLIYQPMVEEHLSSKDPHVSDTHERRFCSRFLINALLALSCLYALEPVTYAVPQDPSTRGRRFADEADAMLQSEYIEPSFALFQGLFAMFCYEGCVGEGKKSVNYLYQAIDIYKALNSVVRLPPVSDETVSQRERHAISWSMWGFYIVEWRATQALGLAKLAHKPNVESTWLESDFPFSAPESRSYWWFPYPISLRTQRSMKVEAREAEVRLAEIVEEALNFIIPSENAPPAIENPQRALQLYDAILDWKYSLPDRLRFEEVVLPSFIIVHVSAELMLTAILHPFSQFSQDQFGRFDPRQRCYSHANRMMTAIWTYRAFAILRTEYWLMHLISAAAFIVLDNLQHGSEEVETLVRAG